jgi:hypothetical protein
MIIKDNRIQFVETFLFESPIRALPFDAFGSIKFNINDLRNSGLFPKKVNDNLNKIELSTYAYYWLEDEKSEIIIGVELKKEDLGSIVTLVGKNPLYEKHPPFASDFYLSVLKDRPDNLIFSDSVLTDMGYNIWKKLYLKGCKIAVYDMSNPGQSFKKLLTLDDFNSFFKNDSDYKKFRYVLSESLFKFGDVISSFNIRRHRELAGIL